MPRGSRGSREARGQTYNYKSPILPNQPVQILAGVTYHNPWWQQEEARFVDSPGRFRSMPRRLRIQFPGAIYHVMSRGNVRQDIVDDDHDRQQFPSPRGQTYVSKGSDLDVSKGSDLVSIQGVRPRSKFILRLQGVSPRGQTYLQGVRPRSKVILAIRRREDLQGVRPIRSPRGLRSPRGQT